MSTKTDFSVEEWTLLLQAITNVATYVITADMSVMGALKEMKAMGKAVEQQSAPPTAQELVNALVSDLKEKSENKESVATTEVKEDEEVRGGMLHGLQDAVQVLDAKCSPEEASGFKLWLLDIAEAVAEADKEGSHFGIGGVQVTDKEKAALSELRSTLGLQDKQ
jgi:hypothetical protein